eukprot:Hpha_TRINITY_DN2323_c0_g1::TRINITY_DN2323_c0_g1_i1::g.372::m.372
MGEDAMPPAMQRVVESLLCTVCWDAAKDTLISPCRHLCICYKCSVDLEDCPLCRGPASEKVQVFTGIELPGRSEGGPTAAGPLVCPLHGERCRLAPFASGEALQQHVNRCLDSSGGRERAAEGRKRRRTDDDVGWDSCSAVSDGEDDFFYEFHLGDPPRRLARLASAKGKAKGLAKGKGKGKGKGRGKAVAAST